ncbi:MAG: glycoside hydrolase family 26 protein [Prevotellaceae bacterium]|jgi:mannan endo-1,4-beta-mannosidase|nr:glycoside hydrolase family 26 protein [Prevotellaceae bacterium]
MYKMILLTGLALNGMACSASADEGVLIDTQATDETKALFRNLKKLQDEGRVLFGQQEAILYGHSWHGDRDRSDVKDVTGSHPTLIGLDYLSFTLPDTAHPQGNVRQLIVAAKETYRSGGVLTFCCHMSNPCNDGSFYWGSDSLKAIPVIFRPFHEFDGDWFWWGKGDCTKDEFITFWRFTVDYLRDSPGVHHFLYAFSPDCKFTTEEAYLDYYPGENYVDIVDFDDYWDFRPDGANNPALAAEKLKIVASIAAKRHKIAAFTETGLEGIVQPDWFIATLLPVLQQARIAYVMLWRNAFDLPNHYYAPFPGHPAVPDFMKFYKNEKIIFQNMIPEMYK